MAKYVSDFGVGVFTGVDEVINKNKSSSLLTYGAVSQLIVPVQVVEGDLAPTANGADDISFGRGIAKIPAGAVIKACYLVIRTPAAASSTLDVGTYKKDGESGNMVAIDADGLLDGAATDTAGLIDTTAGALIGTATTEDNYIGVTGTASDFADVDIDIVVEFI